MNANKRDSFATALGRLEDALQAEKPQGILGELIRDAIIQRFEFTLEMAWKFMRTVLLDEGISSEQLLSPKKTIKSAFSSGLIIGGQIWIDMINDRNTLSHTYNEEDAVELESRIREKYIHEFKSLLVEEPT